MLPSLSAVITMFCCFCPFVCRCTGVLEQQFNTLALSASPANSNHRGFIGKTPHPTRTPAATSPSQGRGRATRRRVSARRHSLSGRASVRSRHRPAQPVERMPLQGRPDVPASRTTKECCQERSSQCLFRTTLCLFGVSTMPVSQLRFDTARDKVSVPAAHSRTARRQQR